MVALVVGWLAGYPEIVAVGIACLLAIVLGLGYLAVRPNVEIERRLVPTRVVVGGDARAEVRLRNLSSRPVAAFIGREAFGDSLLPVSVPRLDALGEATTRYRLPTDRRQVVPVGPFRLTRTDPLGLMEVQQSHGGVDQLWVHPRTWDVPPLPSALQRSLEGPTADTAPQGTITFHTLREYVPGDDRRHIHWRTTARTGTLMVRQLVDTSLPDVVVLLDARAAVHTGASFESAVEIAASLVLSCASHRFPVVLRTTSGVVHRVAGPERDAVEQVLDLLAAAEVDAVLDLHDAAAYLRRSGRGAALLAVTGAVGPDDLALLSPLRRQFQQVVALLVGDGIAEVRAPGVDVINVADGPAFADRWTAEARR